MSWATLGFGFAVRCAAVAMPRRQQPDYSRAVPLVWPYPWNYWAKGRTKGVAQKCIGISTAGIATAAHRAAKPSRTNEGPSGQPLPAILKFPRGEPNRQACGESFQFQPARTCRARAAIPIA